ncbi:MAG: lysylphosphatidylglycerol synthase domain-containing protein [Scytonema sp. PMC 1069.18]|nr:lysylphosphatidylglycerol synthase domain-containing protein [Scytonema sp. PMC 1069.18]MEC4885954.1 lysylphosphatidylglycerol synthase domain-containing protein [Scytonema sp. PMC 1070.18]
MRKQILRWLILGGTLFFLIKAIKSHWQGIASIRIDGVGWSILVIATGVTLLAHICAGWVWTWVLQDLNQPINASEFIQVYLKTNIAKYLPGNVWHYYGRIMAAKNADISTGVATLSVLLEPLIMASAALIIALVGIQFLPENNSIVLRIAELLGLVGVFCVLHPRFLNLGIKKLQSLKLKKSPSTNTMNSVISLKQYPLRPLLGELSFLGLRNTGFILTLFALSPLSLSQIPLLLAAFSFAWLLGLVVPGAPGGLGVFEATAIALLQNYFPSAAVIAAIALYRLISIFAETAGATFAWLDERFCQSQRLS